MRHKHADLIHAWAEGAEIEYRYPQGNGLWSLTITPSWDSKNAEFRIKPKEPEWWKNIPGHGVLVEGVQTGYVTKLKSTPSNPQDYRLLTNEEIERFKR